jgi:hypothetical protein
MKLASVSLNGRPGTGVAAPGGGRDGEILVLSTSLLTDRMLLYSRFLEVASAERRVSVWATSAGNTRYEKLWKSSSARAELFPVVRPFKEFPYNYLRRLNDFAWDFRQKQPSRVSAWRHIRTKGFRADVRALRLPAAVVALARGEERFEDYLEAKLLSYPRSEEALERFRRSRPAVVITTGPFQFEQPAVVAAAKTLGIPVIALIPSWDNLTTKNRMVFKYDGYIVWSQQTATELRRLYPQSREVPVSVIGAPQFDVFYQSRFYLSREEFCASQDLNPELPIIVYAVGSPNFVQERFGALEMAERVARGELGGVQLIIRPHPIHDDREMSGLAERLGDRVVVQKTSDAGAYPAGRCQDEGEIREWVNTFRHADVVINLSSTVTVDAAIFDRPVVNLDYDPEPGQPNQALVKDVNHLWSHFKPIAESGGVWLVNNPKEMIEAVKTYLAYPHLHRRKRRWIAEYVCHYLDGRSGERMAQAVIDFVKSGHRAGTRSPANAGARAR